jgi:hypothetical protein
MHLITEHNCHLFSSWTYHKNEFFSSQDKNLALHNNNKLLCIICHFTSRNFMICQFSRWQIISLIFFWPEILNCKPMSIFKHHSNNWDRKLTETIFFLLNFCPSLSFRWHKKYLIHWIKACEQLNRKIIKQFYRWSHHMLFAYIFINRKTI